MFCYIEFIFTEGYVELMFIFGFFPLLLNEVHYSIVLCVLVQSWVFVNLHHFSKVSTWRDTGHLNLKYKGKVWRSCYLKFISQSINILQLKKYLIALPFKTVLFQKSYFFYDVGFAGKHNTKKKRNINVHIAPKVHLGIGGYRLQIVDQMRSA